MQVTCNLHADRMSLQCCMQLPFNFHGVCATAKIIQIVYRIYIYKLVPATAITFILLNVAPCYLRVWNQFSAGWRNVLFSLLRLILQLSGLWPILTPPDANIQPGTFPTRCSSYVFVIVLWITPPNVGFHPSNTKMQKMISVKSNVYPRDSRRAHTLININSTLAGVFMQLHGSRNKRNDIDVFPLQIRLCLHVYCNVEVLRVLNDRWHAYIYIKYWFYFVLRIHYLPGCEI